LGSDLRQDAEPKSPQRAATATETAKAAQFACALGAAEIQFLREACLVLTDRASKLWWVKRGPSRSTEIGLVADLKSSAAPSRVAAPRLVHGRAPSQK
jgi:hypothetical protein